MHGSSLSSAIPCSSEGVYLRKLRGKSVFHDATLFSHEETVRIFSIFLRTLFFLRSEVGKAIV